MCAIRAGERYKSIAGVILSALSLVCMAYIIRFIWTDDIWYDEVFSLGFTEGSISELTALTARDVHPPLYYIYLKAVTGLITHFAGAGYLIPAAKLASILIWAVLLIIALTYIRRKFGFLTAGLFILAVTAMPQFAVYYTEIRMYSLAMLFVTVGAMAAAELAIYIAGTDDGRPTVQAVILTIAGILTSYTQYYACIAMIGIYAALLILICVYGRERRKYGILMWSACVLISVAAYLPWLGSLLSQIRGISGSYWIQPLTLRSIAGCAKFILLPVVYAGVWPYISAGLTAVMVCIVTVIHIRSGGVREKVYAVLGISPVLAVIISGFILSALGTPIFIYRYMVPAMGALWLYIAIATDRCIEKGSIYYCLILPYIMASVLTMRGYITEESSKTENMAHATEVMACVPENAILIANFDHVAAVLGYLMPDNDIYLYDNEIDKLLPDMFPNIHDGLIDDGVYELVRHKESVFFMGSFNSREDIIKEWESEGIKGELMDSMMIERYWINVYRLTYTE